MTSLPLPKGLVILAHWMYREQKIQAQSIIEALPEKWRALDRKIIQIVPAEYTYGEVSHVYWRGLKAKQESIFREEVEPMLKQHSDYEVLYFGAISIPMAIHFGYLLSSWKNVQIFLHHHVKKTWQWYPTDHQLEMKTTGLPSDHFSGSGDAIIGFGTSFQITSEKTREVIPRPVKEVLINASNPTRDPFSSPDELAEVEKLFLQAMDAIANFLPNLDTVHLFAAVPVGLAFLIGQHINPNIHPLIYVYEYKHGRLPAYEAAFDVQGPWQEKLVIEEEEQHQLHRLRERISHHFEDKVKASLEAWKQSQEKNIPWRKVLFKKENSQVLDGSYWANWGGVWETNLLHESIHLTETEQDTDRFYFHGKWNLTNGFLHALQHQIADENRLFRAIRLFLFHESIHFHFHKMPSVLSSGMGRFPRILEEADYQADVLAMLHEYTFSTLHHRSETKDPSSFFVEMIDTAIETMWAFDINGDPNSMQVRRINRYLIWNFLKETIRSVKCQSFDAILQLLSQKPILEIHGLETKTDTEQRYIAQLKHYNPAALSISVFFRNKIYRRGPNADVLPLNQLIEGFRQRNGSKIAQVIEVIVADVLS